MSQMLKCGVARSGGWGAKLNTKRARVPVRCAFDDVAKLNRLLDAPDAINGEDFALLLSTKCGAFRQVEVRDHRGQVCLFVHTTSYAHEAIAAHFYDRVAGRLNTLHVSYHALTTIRGLDDSELDRQYILPLGVKVIGDDTRASEWDL